MACLLNIRFNENGAYDYLDSSRVFSASGTYNYDGSSPFGGSTANRCLTFTKAGTLSTDPIPALNRGTGDWTAIGWIKRESVVPNGINSTSMASWFCGRTGGLATVIDWAALRGSNYSYQGFVMGTSKNRLAVVGQPGVTSTLEWCHVVVERFNDVIHIWADGVKTFAYPLSSPTDNTFDCGTSGFNLNSDGYSYSGNKGRDGFAGISRFDDFCFFDEALFTDTDAPIAVPDKYFLDFYNNDGGDQPSTDPAVDMKLHVLLKIDQTVDLTGYMHPVGANPPVLVWSSENAAIASVDQNGKVTGGAVGKTRIFVQTQDGSWSAFVRIKVVDVGNDELLLSVLLEVGESCVLFPEFDPADAATAVLWSSSDATIATVNPVGMVTGVAPGLVTITAKTADNKLTDTMYVTVIADKVQG